MRNIVSTDLFLLIFSLLFAGGCFSPSLVIPEMIQVQEAVRSRMLKLRTTDLLADAAAERYDRRFSSALEGIASGYQTGKWQVENDLALKALENAVICTVLLSSREPEKTAAKLAAVLLDYEAAVKLCRVRSSGENRQDAELELAVMTDWPMEKIRLCRSTVMPEINSRLLPIDPEAEKKLNSSGNKAAFYLAAGIFRSDSDALFREAEALHRSILNRYILSADFYGITPVAELRIAMLRHDMFLALLAIR